MNLLLELIKKSGQVSKGDLMQWTYQDKVNKVDSAYPEGLTKIMRENGMLKVANSGNYCYSYINNSWGELENVNDEYLRLLINEMRTDDHYIKLKEIYDYLKQFDDHFKTLTDAAT